jgi:hypothetical protein
MLCDDMYVYALIVANYGHLWQFFGPLCRPIDMECPVWQYSVSGGYRHVYIHMSAP